jgi:arylsulfatase A-like enzyme/Tfp pilus assembly protein PilF
MRRHGPLLALAGVLASGCGGPGPPAPDGASGVPGNVLLITLDTLRADRLGCYGHAGAETPHLDALAARGLRFEQAATVMPLTLPAHSSLMTGTYPAHHGVRDNGGFYLGDEARTLAEVLRDAGYRTGGFVSAFVLDSRWGIAQGFDRFFDDFDLADFDDAMGMDDIQRPGSVTVDEALEWLDDEDPRPFFAWLHLYDPHTPYEAPEPYRSRFPATRSGAYDAEIAWTDSQVGRLLAALDAAGRLDDTLVAVAGDHGEMLGEHGEITHGFFVYDAAVRIPLILAGPGIPAAEVADQVRIVDVLPTVLARLGLPVPEAVQGVDLLPLAAGERLRLVAHSESWFPRYHYGWSELQSIQDGRYKLIKAPRRELYDLEADPEEQRNLAEEQADLADRMEGALDQLLAEVTGDAAGRGPQPVDAETAERLQALGYLGGSSSAAVLDDDRPRGDPKDKIGLYNLLKEATAASVAGDLDVAVATVRRALAEDPEIVEAHMLLGNVLRKDDRHDEAVAAYRDALALDPEHREALYSLALAYKETGHLDEALAGLERAAELDPKNGKVIWQIADVRMRQGRFADAEAELLRALDLDLDRPRFLLKLGECYVEMERLDDAGRRLEEALAVHPDLATVHFTLGLVHEKSGRVPEAIDAYRRELEHNGEAYRAAFNLAKLLQDGGRPRQALEYFKKAVEIQPQFGTGHLYLAKALLDVGDLEGAEASARLGLERSPEPRLAPLGHFILADVYNRQGRLEDAAREEAAGRRLQRSGTL